MGGNSLLRGTPRGVQVAIAVLIPVLLLAGVGYAALHGSPPVRPPRTAIAATPSPTEDPSATPSDVPTPIAGPSTPASATPPATPSAAPSPGRPTPAAARSSAPTTTQPGPVATVSPSAAPGPPPKCQLTLSVSMSKPTYATGTQVTMTIVERNTGNAPCNYSPPDQYGQTPYATITDPSGNRTWCSNGCGLPNTGGGTPPQLAPGASVSRSYNWNQQASCSPGYPGCKPGQVGPGRYTVTAGWDTPSSVTAAFNIGP